MSRRVRYPFSWKYVLQKEADMADEQWYGWQGYFLDTEGNTFGIHQPDTNAK